MTRSLTMDDIVCGKVVSMDFILVSYVNEGKLWKGEEGGVCLFLFFWIHLSFVDGVPFFNNRTRSGTNWHRNI